MNSATTTPGPYTPWDPDELGLPKAAALSVLLVVVIIGFCYWASVILAPKPKLQPIQVTQAQMVTLPTPTPPQPPKVVPPPKPLPAVIPKPPPVQSRIVVATKPPPPVHHVFKPVVHPVVHAPAPPRPVSPPTPAQPTATPVAHPAPQAAPAQNTSGIPIYGQEMHAILQQNQNVPQALAQLGISGTAMVQITVAPDGHVVSAKIIRSSGNPLIDQTALAHAMQASFSAFTANMPASALTFTVPVDIQPQDSGDSDSDSDSGN